jgi:hypothetical protein
MKIHLWLLRQPEWLLETRTSCHASFIGVFVPEYSILSQLNLHFLETDFCY